MRKVLLDTDILSEYLKGYDQNVASRAAAYAGEHRVFTFTSVTVYEITFGLEVKSATSQLRKVLAWLGQNEEITPVSADYRTAALVKATARNQGYVVELPDCLIAAVAARLGTPLVTGNTEDFASIQRAGLKLEIESWREPNH